MRISSNIFLILVLLNYYFLPSDILPVKSLKNGKTSKTRPSEHHWRRWSMKSCHTLWVTMQKLRPVTCWWKWNWWMISQNMSMKVHLPESVCIWRGKVWRFFEVKFVAGVHWNVVSFEVLVMLEFIHSRKCYLLMVTKCWKVLQ